MGGEAETKPIFKTSKMTFDDAVGALTSNDG